MKDEEFVFKADSRDKAITARSARNKKTKGGRVRLPSDKLSKKELIKMSGECKSYRLNEPMTWNEFLSMPDDIKILYIKSLRKKFDCPDGKLGEMFGVSKDVISWRFNKLGLRNENARKRKTWDKEGFYAWMHGVDKLPTPVPEAPVEAPAFEVTQEDIDEIERMMPGVKNMHTKPEIYVEDDLPFVEPDPIDADDVSALFAENAALNNRIDELLKINEELMAVHEKDRAENEWLRNECESQRMNARILEAQMEVVRIIFGGKNHA